MAARFHKPEVTIMKKFSKPSTLVLFCLSAVILPFSAMAQTKPVSSAPSSAASVASTAEPLERIEEAPDSGVKLIKPGPKASTPSKIVEKRAVGGKVTEAEVTAAGSNYTIKANPEIGNAPRGTVQGDANRGAQWKVMEFGGKKEAKEVEEIPTLAPAPKVSSPPVSAPASSAATSSATKK